MNFKHVTSWFFGIVVSSFFCAVVSAEIVYEETFDGDVETIKLWPNFRAPDPEQEWITIYQNLSSWSTEAESGGGNLTIYTEDRNGGVISPADDKYNFFDRELTFTFEGVAIEGLGKSRTAWQWAKLGVVAYSDKIFWGAYSSVIISYNGAGGFSFQVKQPSPTGYDTEPRKDFTSRVFNFDVTFLTKIELTLDSVNYKVAFVFENELDRLTFGGPHLLDRDRWYVDTIGIEADKQRMEQSLQRIDYYQNAIVEAAGDQALIDNLQRSLDAWQGRYDTSSANYTEKLPIAEALKGRSAMLIAAVSDAQTVVNTRAPGEVVVDENGRVGAKLTVDAVRVEATTMLEGL